MNKNEFLEKARGVHGYKYHYINLPEKIIYNDIIKLEYKGVEYTQRVSKHITLGRCPEKNTPSKTTEQFILESKKVWGNKYDYSLVEYKGALKKVKIIYDGIVFHQTASSHLNGQSVESNMNLEYFLKKSREKWGTKYDYTLVEYKNAKTKVKIIYDDIIYEQSPSNHLISAPEKKIVQKETRQFIEQCQKIHNNKYYYDKTIYTKAKNKVSIKCPIHGYFEQVANSHFRGMGCSKCGFLIERKRKNQKNNDSFIKEAMDIWGTKYDYSLVEYKNAKTKVKIIYDDIIYEQLPISHLRYPVESYLDQEIFLKKAIKKWDDKYDYSQVNFINYHHKIKIIYNGITYEQLPHNHLVYAPEKILRKSQEEFITQSVDFHGDKYTYQNVKYINDRIKVNIICPTHGEFMQTPSVHLRSGCPHCKESKGEISISRFLNNHKIFYRRQQTFSGCKNIGHLRFDFYISSMRTAIEFDGIQHFQPLEYFGGDQAHEKLKINDKIKSDYCEENYIDLIRIRYDQIDDIDKILWDNLKNRIRK